jgi:Type III restriction enzyme, res subunit
MKARPYQEKAIQFLVREGKGIVRGPTGSGKTMMSLQAAISLGWERLLIVVPRFAALLAWEAELTRLGIPHTIVKGWSPIKRDNLWMFPGEPGSPERVVVALYPTICKDQDTLMSAETLFDFVICDECHRIKDRRTKTYKAIARVARHKRRFFLSATLQSAGPEDLWAPLSIVSPKGFPSYHKFVERYCLLENDGFTDKITGVRASTLEELRFRTRPYIHNIRTQDIQGYVPERVRQRLNVQLSPRVRKVYNTLWKDSMLSFPDGETYLAPGTLAKFTGIRKLLTCPNLIHEALGVGDALETVWDHAHGENPKPHAVIFSDFKEQFPLWKQWLETQGKGANVQVLQGGLSLSDTKIAIDEFSRSQGKHTSWLLCTVPYAESFDLLSPQDAYFVGFSWAQRMNYQAEGRLTRGSKTHANFFYCVHPNTIDTHMLDVLDLKVQRTGLVASDVEGS